MYRCIECCLKFVSYTDVSREVRGRRRRVAGEPRVRERHRREKTRWPKQSGERRRRPSPPSRGGGGERFRRAEEPPTDGETHCIFPPSAKVFSSKKEEALLFEWVPLLLLQGRKGGRTNIGRSSRCIIFFNFQSALPLPAIAERK